MTNVIFRSGGLTFAFSFIFFITFAQPAKTFSSLKYDKVIIYDYPGYETIIVDEQGRLLKTITKQAILNTAEITKLSKYLDSKNSYTGVSAACFDPHFGIVYYEKGKIIASVSVCFGCDRLQSSIDIEGLNQRKPGGGKIAYYMLEGLSKKFSHFLDTLMTKYKFQD